jgi:hypothetical protein
MKIYSFKRFSAEIDSGEFMQNRKIENSFQNFGIFYFIIFRPTYVKFNEDSYLILDAISLIKSRFPKSFTAC